MLIFGEGMPRIIHTSTISSTRSTSGREGKLGVFLPKIDSQHTCQVTLHKATSPLLLIHNRNLLLELEMLLPYSISKGSRDSCGMRKVLLQTVHVHKRVSPHTTKCLHIVKKQPRVKVRMLWYKNAWIILHEKSQKVRFPIQFQYKLNNVNMQQEKQKESSNC